jgi:hypothetical protein
MLKRKEFKQNLIAYIHLCKLAKLAGSKPSWIRFFTLDHCCLTTAPYTGRQK